MSNGNCSRLIRRAWTYRMAVALAAASLAGGVSTAAAAQTSGDQQQSEWSQEEQDEEEARQADLAAMLESALPSDACPELFGDETVHDWNRARRSRMLIRVRDAGRYVDLVHSGGWRRASRIKFDRMHLIHTMLDAEDGPLALVELTEEFEQCEPGMYLLHVDDSLGGDGRVLAILRDMLVLEYERKLHYLRIGGRTPPEWNLIWQSPWSILKDPKYETKRSSRRSGRKYRKRSRRRRRR